MSLAIGDCTQEAVCLYEKCDDTVLLRAFYFPLPEVDCHTVMGEVELEPKCETSRHPWSETENMVERSADAG
jgi:hypothetical protein